MTMPTTKIIQSLESLLPSDRYRKARVFSGTVLRTFSPVAWLVIPARSHVHLHQHPSTTSWSHAVPQHNNGPQSLTRGSCSTSSRSCEVSPKWLIPDLGVRRLRGQIGMLSLESMSPSGQIRMPSLLEVVLAVDHQRDKTMADFADRSIRSVHM